jgi:hypothetical protein
MRALREIAPGEELTISCEFSDHELILQKNNIYIYIYIYSGEEKKKRVLIYPGLMYMFMYGNIFSQDIKLVDSRAERQKSLYHSYGFHCGCSQCSISDAESRASDLRLDQIVQLWNEVSDWDTHPPPTPAMAEKLIELFKEVS